MTRIVVQQRQRLFREGLAQLDDAEEDSELVGVAVAGADCLAMCEEHRPGVVLMEVDTTEWDAGRVARSLRQVVRNVRTVGLRGGEISAGAQAAARRCGIGAVLSRSARIGRIFDAVRGVPSLGRLRPYPVTAVATDSAADQRDIVLSARELTILNLVGAGFTSWEISVQLAISPRTVENHKQRIFRKLGVQNEAHAVSVAMRCGIMRPERVISLARAD